MTTSSESVALKSLEAFAEFFLALGKLTQRAEDNLDVARQLRDEVRRASETSAHARGVSHAAHAEFGDLSLEALHGRLEAVERRLDLAGFGSAHGADATEAGAA